MATPGLNLPNLAANQNSPEVTVNDVFDSLDRMLGGKVVYNFTSQPSFDQILFGNTSAAARTVWQSSIFEMTDTGVTLTDPVSVYFPVGSDFRLIFINSTLEVLTVKIWSGGSGVVIQPGETREIRAFDAATDDVEILGQFYNPPAVGTKHDGQVTRPVAEVQTTDATQTTIDTITLLDENTYHVEAEVIGVQSTGANRASYKIAGTVYRTAAGSATLQGSVTVLHSAESVAGLDATLTVSGNDVRVSITGIAASTYEWGCILKHSNMSN